MGVPLGIYDTVGFIDSLEVDFDLKLLLVDLLCGNAALVLAPCLLLCEAFRVLS